MLESQRVALEVHRRLMNGHKPVVETPAEHTCEQPQEIPISDPIAELRQEIAKLWAALKKKKEAEPAPPPELNVHDIIDIVASDYNLTRKALVTSGRTRACVMPRHVAMWLARTNTTKSTSQIGRCFHRDHSTVIKNLERFAKVVQADDALRARVLRLQTVVHERTAALERPAE